MNPLDWFRRRQQEPAPPSLSGYEARVHALRMEHMRLVREHFDVFSNTLNPFDEFEGWLYLDHNYPTGTGPNGLVRLQQARGVTRHLASSNGWAQNIHRNLRNYVAGKEGYTHTFATPKRAIGDMQPESFEDLIPLAEAVWEEFVERVVWVEIERDVVSNTHRDGDQFLRFFTTAGGDVDFRVIDAADIRSKDPRYPEGIITAEGDSQRVVGYIVNDDEVIPADEVEHIKVGTDRDVLRGWPTLWAVREKLVRAEKIARASGKLTELQSALAVVREQAEALDAAEFGGFLDGQQDTTKTDLVSEKTVRQQRLHPGAIIDTLPGQKVHFPVSSQAIPHSGDGLQIQLRGIAAAINFPEYMLSADASNNNFASIKEANAPAVKEFESMQSFFGRRFNRVKRRVIEAAILFGRLPAEARFLVPKCVGPSVEAKDELQHVKALETENRNGVLSKQTWSAKRGYDYEQEQTNREEHQALYPDDTGDPLGADDDNDTNEPQDARQARSET